MGIKTLTTYPVSTWRVFSYKITGKFARTYKLFHKKTFIFTLKIKQGQVDSDLKWKGQFLAFGLFTIISCHFFCQLHKYLWLEYVLTKSANIYHTLILNDRYWQSYYREVPRWEIFIEQELRFGLDLGQLAVLKKGSGLIMSNFWGQFFHVFRGKKMLNLFKRNIIVSALKSCINYICTLFVIWFLLDIWKYLYFVL